jgi:hypothetical protein
MFGNKDKRAAASDAREAANASFRAEVERLEALPMAQLAAEVMVKGFGPGGYLPDFMEREPHAVALGVYRDNIAQTFEPELLARDLDLRKRLFEVVGEGLQVLEHESLIWACNVGEGLGVGYVPTRRGRAVLELMLWSRPCAGRAPRPPESPPGELAACQLSVTRAARIAD